MIIDPNKKNISEGFNPNVDNSGFQSQVNNTGKIMWWSLYFLAWCTLIGGIVLTVKWVQWGNKIRQQQIDINEAASAIDVNLTKRKETLLKLVEQTKAYMNFEKSTLENITKLRSAKNDLNSIEESSNVNKIMDSISREININIENYPDLKSSSTISELMSSSQYLESEIAASRRLYNLKVSSFNQNLVIFPISVKAASLKLTSLPLFVASDDNRQDIDMKTLMEI